METVIIAALVIGAVLGSFLNACIHRIPRKISLISPHRSFCPNCNRSLTWKENIPILSWVLLGGKCYGCKARISGRYPFVEIISAFFAALTIIRFGLTPSALIIYLLVLALIVITFIDIDFKIIPNVISLPGTTIGLCLGIVSQYTTLFRGTSVITQDAFDSLLGMLLGGGFFYLMSLGYYLATKRIGLGGGDIKLLAMTGAILGWKSVAPTIFVGSLVGAVVGIITMVISGSGRHTEIPFGPWLALGALLYIFTDIPLFRI